MLDWYYEALIVILPALGFLLLFNIITIWHGKSDDAKGTMSVVDGIAIVASFIAFFCIALAPPIHH